MTDPRKIPNRSSYWRYIKVRSAYFVFDLVALLPLLIITLCSRFVRRPIDVGLGPLPNIANIYHKKCLRQVGYSCETFTDDTWHITDEFDIRFDKRFPSKLRVFQPYFLYVFAIYRYKCLYLYFVGGPLRFTTLLALVEPLLLNLARVKTVVMAFGMDVDELTRTPNREFVAAMARDYPWFRHQRRRVAALIDTWTHGADYIIAGCDWVDYLYYWDKLLLNHFAIDLARFPLQKPAEPIPSTTALRLVHAPNHRHVKGTAHILTAINELKAEGIVIELTMLEGVPNSEVHKALREADVVLDQLVVGWYAMFAMEGMAMGKPVICYLRDDLLDLYASQGLVMREQIPLINASTHSVKNVLRRLAKTDRRELAEIGGKSRDFVERFHSIEAIGRVLLEINQAISLAPSGRA